MDFIKGHVLFAYNAPFDMGFLRQELKLIERELPRDLITVDILSMARALVPALARYNLDSVSRHFGFYELNLTVGLPRSF